MSDPFRLRVLMALTSALEEIRVADGYHTDLSESQVHRGRTTLSTQDPLPAVVILEKPVFPEEMEPPEDSAVYQTRLQLMVQGFAEDDRKHPTDPAYRLLADVRKRLAAERTRDIGFNILGFGDRIQKISIGQGVVRPPDGAVSDTSFFWLPITLEFPEDANDPIA